MPAIFITSITGTQGRVLADLALSQGWEVHGTSRDLSTSLAQSLLSKGVKIHQGSWDDEAVLKAGLAGCQYLYMNLTPDYTDLSVEERQGRAILSLAAEAGISQVVYATSLALHFGPLPIDDNPEMGVQMMKSKFILESLLKENKYGFSHWTILRPGFFMANWLPPIVDHLFPGFTQTGTLKTAMKANTELILVDSADIAAFALAAFQNPEKFDKHAIAVATENKTLSQAVDELGGALGRRIEVIYMSDEEIANATEEGFSIQKLISDSRNEGIDMAEIEAWGVPLGSFDKYLKKERSALLETYGKAT